MEKGEKKGKEGGRERQRELETERGRKERGESKHWQALGSSLLYSFGWSSPNLSRFRGRGSIESTSWQTHKPLKIMRLGKYCWDHCWKIQSAAGPFRTGRIIAGGVLCGAAQS